MDGIIFSSLQPPLLLAPFIDTFLYFENVKDVAHHYTILPDGNCDIVLYFDRSDKLIETQFYGIWSKEINVEVPAKNNVIVISMYPVAAEYLLKFPIGSFLNSFRSDFRFNNLLQPNISYSFKDVVELYSQYFIDNLSPIDYRKTNLFKLIQETKGEISIKEIENKIFWSQRQMNRYFNDWFGISLKAYLNVIRCAKTYKQVKDGDFNPSLSFTDQSHFTKELKKHTGNTPKQLFLKYNTSVQHYSVL